MLEFVGDRWRIAMRGIVLVGLTMVLAACGGYTRTDRPADVETRSETPPPTDGRPQIAAYKPPAQPKFAKPAPKRAVEVLMRRSSDQQRAGDLDGATVSLERALRISPDDAALWNRLAEVRMAQQRHALVVQLAAKSNALASANDRDLRRRNWLLIAGAKRAMGDASGARYAENQAAASR